MPYSPPNELKHARELLDEDKYQETLDLLTKFGQIFSHKSVN